MLDQGIEEDGGVDSEERELDFPEAVSGSLAAGVHYLDSGNEQVYQVTHGLATDEQIKALFRRKRPKGDLLQPSNFIGGPCYEIWIKGSLSGLAVLTFSGVEFSDEIYVTVLLDAIYLASQYRGKGFVYPFLDEVAKHAYQVAMAPLLSPGRAMPEKAVKLTITAELHSIGGQTAVRILGDSLSGFFELSGFPPSLMVEVETDEF